MITHETPLEHNDRALRQSPVVPARLESGTPLSRKDRLSITALATVTLLAGGIKYGGSAAHAVRDAFNPDTHHKYTNEQLAEMKQAQEIVQPGEGAEAEVLRVDPQLINDQQGMQDVVDYVQLQGNGPSHQLQAHQQVLVPVIRDK